MQTEDLARFRDVLARADYTDKAVVETLGSIEVPIQPSAILPHYLRLTKQGRKLDTLIRLFLLGVPADIEAARYAFEPIPLEEWVRAGFVNFQEGSVTGAIRLLAFRDLVLIYDQPEMVHPAIRAELVAGLSSSTISLVYFAIRRPSRMTLDLGTGGGVQAFLAAKHSEQVYAVDCSARALEYANFNARFNGITNVEFRRGDAYDPVRGLKFDLVISNPPFAVSPSMHYHYRDSGLGGDQFCRNLLRQAPQFLNEGGYCQILCDWAHIAGQDWKERLAGWFEGTGCDAWVLRTDTQDVGSYARMWIRDTEGANPAVAARTYEEWISYYEREGIEEVSSGLIALRRASGRANWIRMDDAPQNIFRPFGEYVALGFELRDFLEATKSDEKLLDARIRVSPDAHLEQECEWQEAAWRITSAKMRLNHGLPWVGNVDRNAINLIARFDGKRTVRDALDQFAAVLGAPAARVAPASLPLIRHLLERGFLLPETNNGNC
jgi:SAM-dependent methyltransferase